MHDFLVGLGANTVLKVTLLAWIIAQVSKVLLNILTYGRLDLERLVGSGGMPSSHAAVVMALSFSVGKRMGWDSVIFAVTLVFGAVVMYDAVGVRRAAGQQAEAINQIVSDIYHGTQISRERLKELIGHTPFEVLVGAVLGIVVGLVF